MYTRNPNLLTVNEQQEEGDFVTGSWSDYFFQLQTFSEIQQERLVLLLRDYHMYWHSSIHVGRLKLSDAILQCLQEEGDFITGGWDD